MVLILLPLFLSSCDKEGSINNYDTPSSLKTYNGLSIHTQKNGVKNDFYQINPGEKVWRWIQYRGDLFCFDADVVFDNDINVESFEYISPQCINAKINDTITLNLDEIKVDETNLSFVISALDVDPVEVDVCNIDDSARVLFEQIINGNQFNSKSAIPPIIVVGGSVVAAAAAIVAVAAVVVMIAQYDCDKKIDCQKAVCNNKGCDFIPSVPTLIYDNCGGKCVNKYQPENKNCNKIKPENYCK